MYMLTEAHISNGDGFNVVQDKGGTGVVVADVFVSGSVGRRGLRYHLLGRVGAARVAFITGVIGLDEQVWIEMWVTKADDYLVKVRLIGPSLRKNLPMSLRTDALGLQPGRQDRDTRHREVASSGVPPPNQRGEGLQRLTGRQGPSI